MYSEEIEEFLGRKSFSKQSFVDEGLQPAEQITITSCSGAGKSVLLAALKREFPEFQFCSGGQWMRDKAKELGFPSIEAFAQYNRKHPEKGYDRECDGQLRMNALMYQRLIQESRFSHCTVPNGYHILLVCPLSVRACRRFTDESPTNQTLTMGKVLHRLHARDLDDTTRLSLLYPDYQWASSDFDLVIDTEHTSKAETARRVITGYYGWRKKTIDERIAQTSAVLV